MNIKILISIVMLFRAHSGIGQSFDVMLYGAVNDSSRLSTEAFNKAIDACYQAGGGRVIIPAGAYKSGTIVLKDNVELHLSAGARLYASTEHHDFPRQERPAYRSQKDPGGWYALIYAANARNISVTGSGLIDGNGARQKPRSGPTSTSAEGKPTDMDGRPRNLLFISCTGVNIEGIRMRNAGIWNLHVMDCEDVRIDHINVYNHGNRNNDGVDIDASRRVRLTNSTIDSFDDAVVLKTTGAGRCEDILVDNCILSTFRNALKCGTESTGLFRNIVFSNCIVRPSSNTATLAETEYRTGITAIALEIVDGGTMDGVNIHDIMIEGTQCPIYIRLGNRARKHITEAPTPGIGFMRNISVSDITANSVGNFSSSITGIPGRKISQVRLNNINVHTRGLNGEAYTSDISKVPELEANYPRPNEWGNLPAAGFFIRHVEDITLQGIQLNTGTGDPRHPVVAVDVERLYLDALATNRQSAADVLVHAVKRLEVDATLKVKQVQQQ